MGSGKWYGVPELRRVHRWSSTTRTSSTSTASRCPTTFDEFTAAMDAFAKKGVTPLANAGAEYPAQQYLYQLALSKADRPWVDAYELYKGKVDFHDAAWTYAATTFADWVKKGYIAKKSGGAQGRGRGRRVHQRQVPDLLLRQLVVRPLQDGDQASTGAPSCGPAAS